MSASQFANFAAYTPPPDELAQPSTSTSHKSPANPWFHTLPVENSYQSGGIPTFNSSIAGETSAVPEETSQNQWETRYGWRVDLLASGAYLLGPISALILLISETHNDYVRFHAYQSALLTTPLILLRIFFSIAQFSSWIRGSCTWIIFGIQFFMAISTYRDASRGGLVHFRAPFVGPIAEKWLAEE